MGAEASFSCACIRALDPGRAPLDLAEQARHLGVDGVSRIDTAQLVFIRAELNDDQRSRLLTEVLADPLLQRASWNRDANVAGGVVVETILHAGVTDPVAQAVVRGAALAGVVGIGPDDVATGTRYEITGQLTDADVKRLITRLLANPVIEHAAIGRTVPASSHDQDDAAAVPAVETIIVSTLDGAGLARLSTERGLALDPAELVAVQSWFGEQRREPTDVELEAIAQTWSEHCAHKTFRAAMTWDDGTAIEPLLRQLRRATDDIGAPWVRSAFVDNAGIIAFDDDVDLAIKAETHNHPSAIEPFGGANTGVGGVLRDVLGVSARPIAITDVLCFGMVDADPAELPAGVLHPRRIRDGVIAGVADYGNKLGVPTIAGAIVHDPGYTANPLVFCGCIGEVPVGAHRTSPQVGDRVVVIGGRTGRDGIRGATFSSATMDATTGEVAGASVQIGDPIVEKGVLDVLIVARDEGLYNAVTDCGAGGLSSAVGEMAATLGADVSLDAVPRKYAGLAPWEVWLSEAQERMVFAVPSDAIDRLSELCVRYAVELADIGSFTGDGRLVVRDGGRPVLDLDVAFLHDGRPTRSLVARRPTLPHVDDVAASMSASTSIGGAAPEAASAPAARRARRAVLDPSGALTMLLAHPSLRSQLDVVRGYDHEIIGRTVVRPYGGAADDGPSDAALIRPPRSTSGALAAIGIGVNARYGARDAYAMAWSVIDEAIRNVVATGADPDRIALLDNFSWGDPRRPETLGQLVEAVRGCADAARAHGAPFVSGKDSLNNEYATIDGARLAIPPTLVIHALGRVPDQATVVTSDLKAVGNTIWLVGQTWDELGGSHLDLVLGRGDAGAGAVVPSPDVAAPARYRALHRAMRAGLVAACHDLAEGGLAVAAAEMVIAGRLGLSLTVTGDETVALFSESNGRFLVEVAPAHADAFAAELGADAQMIGTVTDDPALRIASAGCGVTMAMTELLDAWAGHLSERGAPGASAPTIAPVVPSSSPHRSSPTPAVPSGALVPAIVLAAPGTNRDGDVVDALNAAGADAVIVPLSELRADPKLLRDARIVVVAGGFSFADALGSGALYALELADILGDAIGRLTDGGRPVLGICNGFQTLVRLGVLPGGGRRAALGHNAAGRFECRWVTLIAPESRCVWTRHLPEAVACPVAHGEGRFIAEDDVLDALRANGQIALRYGRGDGTPANRAYPDNPNGSYDDIAGICDETGLVLGLMPHPENHVQPWQHPRWSRGERGNDGLALFRNGVRQARES